MAHFKSNSKVAWCVAGGVAVGAVAVLAGQAIARRFRTNSSGAGVGDNNVPDGGDMPTIKPGPTTFNHGTAPSGEIVRNDVSSQFTYPDNTRREERWPEDSPEYKAGHARHNRVKPPPPEVEGDVFDRQRCIIGFDQGKVEACTCFVLGTGGIGQDVALTLARLGVGKIIMLDCDSYDASNLTRQCLGAPKDVGRRKVDAAADNIRHHNLRSEIVTIHADALECWPLVVKYARESDVIFNGVDVGPVWDLAVNALGRELGIPTVAGQSYDLLWDVEFYDNKPGHRCSQCNKDTKSFEEWVQGQASHFGARADRDRTAMIDRMFPSGVQSLDVNGILRFLKSDRAFRLDGPTARTIVAKALTQVSAGAGAGAGAGAPPAGVLSKEQAGAFFNSFCRLALARMVPGAISMQTDLRFIPRPKHVETRFVGSWVCPCLAAAVHMVALFTVNLFGEDGIRNDIKPATTTTMLLGEGRTATEAGLQDELMMAKQGIMPVEECLKAPPYKCTDASAKFCVMCQIAAGNTTIQEALKAATT